MTDRIMNGRGWMPFKIINPKTCEVMGLEQNSIHLGHYDCSRGRIDLLDKDFKPYMSLTRDSAIPMHVTDINSYSILSKQYAAAIFDSCYSHTGKQAGYFYKIFAERLGITVPTLKNWMKKHL